MTDYEQMLALVKRFKALRYEELFHDPSEEPSPDKKDWLKVIKVMDGNQCVFFEFDVDGNVYDYKGYYIGGK